MFRYLLKYQSSIIMQLLCDSLMHTLFHSLCSSYVTEHSSNKQKTSKDLCAMTEDIYND